MPSAVLFPHTVLPLHIFEPRYRALVRDALAGDKVMALAQLEPGCEGHYAGRPRMRPMVCAGIIAWHEELDDGRYNIIVQGVARARLLEELPPDQLYREVRAASCRDTDYHGARGGAAPAGGARAGRPAAAPVAQKLLQVAARATGGALADVVASSRGPGARAAPGRSLCELDVRAAVCARSWPSVRARLLARPQPRAKPDGAGATGHAGAGP